MARGWWRTNLLALMVLAVLIPFSIASFSSIEVGAVRNGERDVAPGQVTEYGDWEFGPATVRPYQDDEIDVPPGRTLMIISVRLDPGKDKVSCVAPTLRDADTGKTYRSSPSGTWMPGEGETSLCPTESRAPVDLVSMVFVPADADRLEAVVFTTGVDGATDIRLGVDD